MIKRRLRAPFFCGAFCFGQRMTTMHIDGQCHCGEITFEAEIDPETVSVCHCTDCQTLTGSPFRVTAVCSGAEVRLTAGTPRIYGKRGDNGRMRFSSTFAPTAVPRCSRAATATRRTIGASAGAASASATNCGPSGRSGASRRRCGSTRCRCCRAGHRIEALELAFRACPFGAGRDKEAARGG